MTFTRRAVAASATLVLVAQVFAVEAVVAPSGANAQPDAEARRSARVLPPIARGGQALDQDECFDKGRLDFFNCPDDPAVITPAPVAPAPGFVLLSPRWTGWNIGGHLGFGVADATAASTFQGAPVAQNFSGTGFLGGGQLGYNFQFRNNVVMGAEIDGSFVDVTADAETAAGTIGEADINFTATARARLGYAFGRVMPFISGGGGLVGYEGEFTNGLGATASFDETAFAPVVGGGFNFLVTNRMIASVETQYFFLDEEENLPGLGGAADRVTIEDYFGVRFGFNYKF